MTLVTGLGLSVSDDESRKKGHENPFRYPCPVYAKTIMVRAQRVRGPKGGHAEETVIGYGVRCVRCGQQFDDERAGEGHKCDPTFAGTHR